MVTAIKHSRLFRHARRSSFSRYFAEWGRTLRAGLLLLSCLAAPAQLPGRSANEPLELIDGDRVVFIGSRLMERAAAYGYTEAALNCRWPHRDLRFRNLGRSGDTVFGRAWVGFGEKESGLGSWRPPPKGDVLGYGLQRLVEEVQAEHPTVIFLGYGSNESHDGQPGLARFRQGLKSLIEALEETGARIILVSPTPQLSGPTGLALPDPRTRNESLKLYANALGEVAREGGHRFVDLFTRFSRLKATQQQTLSDNGSDLNARGCWVAAEIFEEELGLKAPRWQLRLTARGEVISASGTELDQIETAGGDLEWRSTDQRLPSLAPPGGSGVEGVLTVDGLAPGRHALTVDGQKLVSASASAWAGGVGFAAGPELDQAERLRQLIVEKNRLHFYFSRPLNATYLFLFRRYEMGHLAGEFARYKELIEEKEVAIARLCRATPRRYELVLEKDYGENHYVPETIPEPDIDAEIASFELADGFEIDVFASNPMVANPTQINFDALGRIWVAGSVTYPHLKPGEKPNDRITILEDSDGDGKADRYTVFAEGLFLPYSVLPADGGAYVTHATEILFLKDNDGDGRADEKKVLFSGFGNADAHQIIHALRRGPGGGFFFNQSIYINSHVETRWGVRRLEGSGIWHFRTDSMRLEVFLRGLINPWGHAYDRWGQSFATDGAHYSGISYAFPGAAYTTATDAERVLASLNAGQPKYCGLEILSGRHLPEAWRGALITTDFRANRVTSFSLSEEASAYASRPGKDLLSSKHVSFRPVDMKMGPDGAIYIADWYSPTIGHGEVDFYHPARDHSHGRIWRLSATDRAPVEPPKLVGVAVKNLLEALKLPEDLSRRLAREQLALREPGEVLPVLRGWVRQLDPEDADFEHHRLEALWSCQALGIVENDLLGVVLASRDHRARAAAVRVLGDWHQRANDALELLATAVADAHPRVRLEAVNALRRMDSAEAVTLAMRVLDRTMDRFLDYAAWLTARELQERWLPLVEAAEPVFGGKDRHLTFALLASNRPQAVRALAKLFHQGRIGEPERDDALERIAALGGVDEMRLILELGLGDLQENRARGLALLHVLDEAASRGRSAEPLEKPSRSGASTRPRNAAELLPYLDSDDVALRRLAARLAGRWQLAAAHPRLLALASEADAPASLRLAAANALVWLDPKRGREELEGLAATKSPVAVRATAVSALAGNDQAGAGARAVSVLEDMGPSDDAGPIFGAFLSRGEGVTRLTRALENRKLKPEIARKAILQTLASGRKLPGLIAALTAAGSLEPVTAPSAAEKLALIAEIGQTGDATRGEAIFRRADLGCMRCHALGGAGGRVGPELGSLGTSATVAYVLESLIEPEKEIKDGYRSLSVIRKDGRLLTGIRLRDTDTHVWLRDAEGRDLSVVRSEIAHRSYSGVSLMPGGLTETLRRDELVDLTRFLSELGKEGPYKISTAAVARRWEVLEGLPEEIGSDLAGALETEALVPLWKRIYTTASGDLPLDELPKVVTGSGRRLRVVRFQIEVTVSGRIGLLIRGPAKSRIYVGGSRLEATDTVTPDVERGVHNITLELAGEADGTALRVEVVQLKGSAGRARPVLGP